MNVMRFFANFAVGIVMGLCFAMIFMSLFLMNLFDNTENIDEIAMESAMAYVEDHKEEVKEFIIESGTTGLEDVPDLNKESIQLICMADDPAMKLSDELCNNIDTMEEQEAVEMFFQEVVDAQVESGAFDEQIESFSETAKSQIRSKREELITTVGPVGLYLGIGIVGYLLAVLLIFAIAKFNVKLSLYKVGRNTFFNSLAFVVAFGYIALLTPGYITGLMNKVVGAQATLEVPEFLLKLVVTLALDVLKSSTNPLLIAAIIISALSLALAITMRTLLKKEGAVKPEPNPPKNHASKPSKKQ